MNEKNKDPAFLFYPSDFLVGTQELTEKEVGQYTRLLCYVHQKGHLSIEIINRLIPEISEFVLQKFIQDKDGNYYNKRLENEMNKRAKHIDKQRENGQKGGRPKNLTETQTKPNENPKETQGQPKQKPLENENENEVVIENINISLEGVVGEGETVSNDVRELFDYVEKLFSRPLSQPETKLLLSFREMFDDEIIILAFDEMAIRGKLNMKYTQSILENWKGSNVRSLAEAKLQCGSSKKTMSKEEKLNAAFGN